MSAETPLGKMLDRLEQEWRRHGTPLGQSLAPGLSPEEIESTAGGLGAISTELRAWWGWHNGVFESVRSSRSHVCMGPGMWDFLSLEQALAQRAERLNLWGTSPEPDADNLLLREAYWHETWLPIVSRGADVLFTDVSGQVPDGPAPIYLWELPHSNFLVPVYGSLLEVVSLWVESLEQDRWYYVKESEAWNTDLPKDPRLHGIA